jgi:23S rRNA pseudouridine1911/1915/1917 synthase
MKYSDKEEPFKVLYCDNHLLVVDKKANLLTQPNETKEENLEDLAKEWVKREFHKPGNVFLHCVHRIDKPVSGIVVFARTSKALSRLNEEIRERSWRRIYYAIVEGVIEKKEQKVVHGLIHGSHKALVSSLEDPNAKKAELLLHVEESNKKYSFVRIELLTGRYHQIRAQMAALAHPIVGDEKYGSKTPYTRILLHQGELELSHPVTKERMAFQTSPPFSLRDFG